MNISDIKECYSVIKRDNYYDIFESGEFVVTIEKNDKKSFKIKDTNIVFSTINSMYNCISIYHSTLKYPAYCYNPSFVKGVFEMYATEHYLTSIGFIASNKGFTYTIFNDFNLTLNIDNISVYEKDTLIIELYINNKLYKIDTITKNIDIIITYINNIVYNTVNVIFQNSANLINKIANNIPSEHTKLIKENMLAAINMD